MYLRLCHIYSVNAACDQFCMCWPCMPSDRLACCAHVEFESPAGDSTPEAVYHEKQEILLPK